MIIRTTMGQYYTRGQGNVLQLAASLVGPPLVKRRVWLRAAPEHKRDP
jgi:hypothetical protein